MNAQGDHRGASGSVNAQRARRGCGCIPANAQGDKLVWFGVDGL